MPTILLQPRIQFRQPLGIDERLENPPHLELAILAAQASQEAKLHHPIDVAVDAACELHLVGRVGQEHAHQVHDFVAGEDQPGVAAGGVVLGELFAQQRQ